jgi:thioredoxin
MAIVTCSSCGAKNRVDESAAARLQPVCGKCKAALGTSARTGDPIKPRTVTDATFSQEVLEAGDATVLLDCWADWCKPCRMIAPVLDELAAESGGRYIIAKLNVDENPLTAAQFNVRSIPTMLIFKNGVLADRIVGAQSKQAIAAHLK